eukprot:gene428-541_t
METTAIPTETTTTTTTTTSPSTTPAPSTTTTVTNTVRSDQYINQLYDIANKLDSNPSFEGVSIITITIILFMLHNHNHDELLYNEIIELSQKSKQTKQLSSQFLGKYFKRFSKYQEKALDCLIDLFESEDVAVRVNALKSIPIICKDNPEHIAKLVDILAQLMNTDSMIELENTKNSLIALYQLNSATTINSILTFIESENNKEFMITFLKEKLLAIIKNEYSKSTIETQTFFRDRILKLIAIVTSDSEANVLFELLDCFPQYKLQDAVTAVDSFITKVETMDFPTIKNKMFHFMKLVIIKANFNQTNQTPTPITCKLATYYNTKVFPSISQLDETSRIEAFSLLAQITPILNSSDSALLFEPILNFIKQYIPTSAASATSTTTTTDSTTAAAGMDVDLQYSIIESLLYSFANLGSKSLGNLRKLCGYKITTGQPSDMNTEIDPAKHNDLITRFRFLDVKTRECSAKAKKALEAAKEKTQKQFASKTLKSTQNIIHLVTNLSKNPPNLSTISNGIHLSTNIYVKYEKNKNKPYKPPHQQNQQGNRQQHQQQQGNRQHQNQQQGNRQQHQQQQQPQHQQRGEQTGKAQQQKSTRYSPYVVPGKRQQQQQQQQPRGGNNNNNNDGGFEMQYFTDRSRQRPNTFKGRGSKNY